MKVLGECISQLLDIQCYYLNGFEILSHALGFF